MNKVETYMNKVGLDYYYDTSIVQKTSQKTNLKPPIIVLSLIVLLVIFLLTPLGQWFSIILCFAVPAYETYKCIEMEKIEQDERLLTYWVVYGFFFFFDQILSYVFSIVPFYYILRAGILIYIFVPEFNGAQKLYKNMIKSFLDKYQSTFETILSPFEHMGNNVKQVVQKNKEE